MRSIKILIVANNCPWKSREEKIRALRIWYGSRIGDPIDLCFDLVHTQYNDVPMMTMTSDKGINYKGVDAGWYDKNITPRALEYDMVLFVMNVEQWGSTHGARGWRTDADQGPIQLQVSAGEHETVFYQQFGEQPAFFQFACHEIMHALYMLNLDQSIGDRTHYWWDRGTFGNALDEIDIGNNRMVVGDIWGFIYRLFSAIGSGKTQKWADAIKEHEGYAPGTRSFRNNNPGNFRYTGYIKSLGAIGYDKDNFAVFGTYEAGYTALKSFLSDAKADKLISYRSNMTLIEFFSVYAPAADHNDPNTYAAFVARRIGVSAQEVISNL